MTRPIRQQSRRPIGKRKPADVRPTTSRVLSALFSMFGPDGVEGLSVLDLYAGTGGFGLEALERGAALVVMVEKSRRRCDGLKAAVARQSAESRARVIAGDVLRTVPTLEGPFDVVFADPPYADDPFADLAVRLTENNLVSENGTVLLEHFHKTALPESLSGLALVTRRRYGDAGVSVYRPTGGQRKGSEKGEGA